MKKKLFALSLALAVLMGLLPYPAEAATVLASGDCGTDGNEVIWTLKRKTTDSEQDGLMTISGIGAMRNYDKLDDVPWHDYLQNIEAVVIENGVTSIGKNAFQECTNLKSVTLPDSLTVIGDAAFFHCNALTELTIPGSVTSIGKNAFGLCALTKVEIPKNVTTIGESVFYKCAALEEITVNEENTAYSAQDGVLFNHDKTTLICYPAKKSATEYTAPETVTEVGSYAFFSASVLTSVTFPQVKNGGLKTIGENAFAYSAVEKLSLPTSLTTIGDWAFYECAGLSDEDGKPTANAEVNYKGTRQQWSKVATGEGNYRLTNSNIVYDDTKPDNVLASGECGALGNNALWSVRTVKSKDEDNKEIEETELLISGEGAMRDYRSAADVPWASYKPDADAEAVDYRPQIQKVRVEEGITNFSNYACYDCPILTTAILPTTLKSIGSRAFADCAELTNIKVKLNSEEDAPGLSETALESIGSYAFNGCSKLVSITFPETLETIGGRAFLNCVALTEITIPSAVTEIGDWAFRKCEALTTFTMEPLKEDETPHYMSLGAYALADCKALETLSFTENLTVIGDYALRDCAKLTTVGIPVSVTGIGNCVFMSCPSLEAVNVLTVVKENGVVKTVQDAYDEVKKNEAEKKYEVVRENEAYCTMNFMLMNKDQTYILCYPGGRNTKFCLIPEGVTNIASYAFQTASGLEQIAYAGNWSQWHEVVIGEQGNEPLLKKLEDRAEGADPTDDSQPFYCMQPDPTGGDSTRVDFFTVEQKDEGGQVEATVHCGKDVEGAWALCAMYDKNGRFLSMETQEMAPGEDTDLSFALVDRAETVYLFVIDGKNVPQCKREVWPPPEQPNA